MFKLIKFLVWTLIVFIIGYICSYLDLIPQLTEMLGKIFK